MIPLDPSVPVDEMFGVRKAEGADREQLSNLIFLESHVHRHLDWRGPLDWLEHSPFWVLEEGKRITAALACPPDPDDIAWIRLFAFEAHVSGRAAWQLLWKSVQGQLLERGGATVAAIAIQRWLDPILLEHGFAPASHIVMLEMDSAGARPPQKPAQCRIRLMVPGDLPRVVALDSVAFEHLWRNSIEALTKAYTQASYASVAEDDSGLLGYQLSTGGSFGTHLARLAVLPAAQRRGLGAALVNDLIAHIPAGREPRLTVNTQADNSASLALYYRLGFRRTGERYPVYAFEVRPPDALSSGPRERR